MSTAPVAVAYSAVDFGESLSPVEGAPFLSWWHTLLLFGDHASQGMVVFTQHFRRSERTLYWFL
jgi:hypothetical protein